MDRVSASDVLRAILEIAERVKYRTMFNERYLHHFFSHLIQERCGQLDLTEDAAIRLRPEWPTYKEGASTEEYGQYRTVTQTRNSRRRRILEPAENSRLGGEIDFAVGRYERPVIGIEFTLSYRWPGNDVEGDLIKLLDSKNPFEVSISLNLVLREKGLSERGLLTRFENAMNERLETAVERLREHCRLCDNSQRRIYLVVTEVGIDNARRHWNCCDLNHTFTRGLPKELD